MSTVTENKEETKNSKFNSFYDLGESKEQSKKFLTFHVDDNCFALPIEKVIEIINMQDITYIPCMPSYVKGVTNIRGKVVPVIDLRERLSKPAVEYTDKSQIIVTGTDDEMLGYICQGVDNIEEAYDSDIMESPVNEDDEESFTSAIVTLKSGFAMIMNLEALSKIKKS